MARKRKDNPRRYGHWRVPLRAGARTARPRDMQRELEELRALRTGVEAPEGTPPAARKRRFGKRRALKFLVLAIVGWLLLSTLLFLISGFEAPGEPADVKAALSGGSLPIVSATTVLVLGSDQRTASMHEPGAGGPSRSDTMMLIHVGGGHSSRLSIPRDTVVDIPGHGNYKINAAYAFGGPALAIRTVEQYLGVPINHIVEINFGSFPALVDAMGGVTFSTKVCVVSKLEGGFRNGGFTLRLTPGTHHLDGKQALALARTRENLCHPSESDLTRVVRQQELFQDMKSQLLSVGSFFRLPWIAWNAPPTLKTDMSPFSLLGLFGTIATSGQAKTEVLKPDGTTVLPDGESGLTVSSSEWHAAAQAFLSS